MPTTAYHLPDDRYYEATNHMWAKPGPESGQVTIGIDTLGLEALGELAYISFQPTGSMVEQGQSIGMLEAAKMTGDIASPVSGKFVACNQNVLHDPLIVNGDPYGTGWLAVIEPTNWEAEAAGLVHGPALPAWITAEVERYRSQGWID